MIWKQYELTSRQATMVCWLSDKRLKKGVRVTLEKIPGVTWTVTQVYSIQLNTPPDKTWKVGGLS